MPHAPTGFVSKYIFSTDHKVIGIQYILLAMTAVVIGVILSVIMRFHLAWPGAHIPFISGGIMTPEQYAALLTMHGTIMVFFVLTTAPQGGFGNYFLPIQIGAPDMAFPRLNMLSFWVTFLAFVAILAAFVVPGGAPISGWTGYAPLSGLGEVTGPGEGWGQTMWIISISLFCLASLLGALNFIATTIDMRAPGMSLFRMPLTVWGWFVTAILGLLAFGVLLAGGVLLLARSFGGHELLHSGRDGGKRPVAAPQRRLAASVAALVLVLRPPRGLHRDSAGHGRGFPRPIDVLAQASVRISRDGWRDLRDRFPGIHGLGTPHVRQRHEPLFGLRVFRADDVHRRSLRDQDVQLAGNAVGREDSVPDADAVRARFRFAVRQRRPFGTFPCAAGGGQSACTPPTTLWPTSTW